MEIHAPLPALTNPMISSANTLVSRLPVNKPVARNNWGFRLGDQLDLSTRHSEAYKLKLLREVPTLDNSSIGEKIFLRVEHQTLSRLGGSGNILFTIHTYHNSLGNEAADPERRRKMYEFVSTTPKDLIEYKQMASFYDLLLSFLNS